MLLIPVMALTLALGAIQALAPKDAARRQLALLPPATLAATAGFSLAALAATPATLEKTITPLEDRPQTVAVLSAATPIRMTAVYERARSVPTDVFLAEMPPRDVVRTRLATLGHPDRCVTTPPTRRLVSFDVSTQPSPEAFGRMLAAAARQETEDLVVYSDRYKDIGFPMGDVPQLYGVCTDVVVRAYRALGIDLQVLVHNAKLGTGDPSIDHRRVETLRRFFGKYGTSIAVTDFPEEYQPGDIVTYRRPEGRGSQTHIGIVSDVMAPSGRPMIVHNRGWGPQLEDALFANGITGHYRFAAQPGQQMVSQPVPPLPVQRAAQTPWPEDRHLKVTTAR